jgi:hypothetical protein
VKAEKIKITLAANVLAPLSLAIHPYPIGFSVIEIPEPHAHGSKSAIEKLGDPVRWNAVLLHLKDCGIILCRPARHYFPAFFTQQ